MEPHDSNSSTLIMSESVNFITPEGSYRYEDDDDFLDDSFDNSNSSIEFDVDSTRVRIPVMKLHIIEIRFSASYC